MPISDTLKSSLIGVGGGLLNLGIQRVFDKKDKEAEKQWWYEQQKFLEEHNSPAYRSMQMRQAGLNPYSEVSSTPLGNVDSSLPRMNASHTFDVNAIQNSLLMDAQRENIEQDTKLKGTQSDLNESKLLTENEWRSNIIQQTLNLEQEYNLGLISGEEKFLKLQEYKTALGAGYNGYLIEYYLGQSQVELNRSLKTLNEAKTETEQRQAQYVLMQTALTSLYYTLEQFYQPLERQAKLDNMSLNQKFEQAKFDEFMSTQETRIALQNIELAFAKFKSDELTRIDEIRQWEHREELHVLKQIVEACESGKGLEYVFKTWAYKDPQKAFSDILSLTGAIAPQVNISRSSGYNYSESNSNVTRKTEK